MQPKIPFGPFVLAVCLAASPHVSAGGDSCPGRWRSLGLGVELGGTADVISLPGGAIVVGLKADGLRFYERGPTGVYTWRGVTTATPGSGLASNKVTSLALFLGELWIGTQDAGISILTPETNAWRTLVAGVTTFPSNTIHHLTAVPADPAIASPGPTDESLWVSTPAGAAVYQYVGTPPRPGWRWGLMDQAHGLPESYIRDTAVQFLGGQRYTWFATYGNLVRWDGTSFEPFGGSCDFTTAERIVVDASNRVWIAGLKAIAALGGGDGDGGGGATVYVPTGLCRGATGGRFGGISWTSFPDQYGHDMSADRSGRLWASGIDQVGAPSKGAWVHDQGSWCVFHKPDLTTDEVSCVHATGELTWFGQNATARLETYSNNWSAIHKLDYHIIDHPGPLAFGASGTFVGGFQGLSHQPGPDASSSQYLKLSDHPSAYATAVLPVEDGVWVGMAPDGLRFVEIDPVNRSVVGTTAHRAADGLAGDGVQAIARDQLGRIWVGTSQGLSLRGNGYWLSFTTASSPLASDDVRALAVDAQGKLWIGTAGGGISILDTEAQGGNAWSTQTTADGLAADDIHALAIAPGGAVWAATSAGACERDPATGAWAAYTAAAGDLPGDQARSLTIDSAGRVWVGTTAGLAVREAGEWRHYHVTSSSLDSDLVEHLTARGTELWAAAGNLVSVRRDIEGPIGVYPPAIASINPGAAAPGDLVTVNGTGFDERGPGYNQVFVGGLEGSNGGSAQPSEILSVTSTQIVFRVRALAQDGKVRVIAHCLEGTSAATLRIAPTISFAPTVCANMGDLITILGAGFTVGGGAEVRFGNGPWRQPVLLPGGELRPDRITLPLTAGDQEGQVQVRGSNGLVATSAWALSVGHVELMSRKAYQGVEGVPLIWGKRTLVSIRLSTEGCSAKVTGGSFYWKKKDNTLQLGGRAYARDWGTAVALDIAGSVSTADPEVDALELVGEFETARSNFNSFFPLAELASIVCVIRNGSVDVLTVEIPAAELKFQEVKKRLELSAIAVFPETGGDTWQDFWAKATASLEDLARIMPQPDFAPMHGSAAWIRAVSSYFEVETADLRSDLLWGDFMSIRSTASDLIDPGFGQFGMAMIDESLYVDHKEPDDPDPSGKAMIGPYYNGDTAVSFNFENKAAPTITQELCHMLGMVDGDAENHDDENDYHSVYDEGEALDADLCAESPSLTFWEAMRDQLGLDYPELYRITSGAPRRLDLGACSDERARSCMSYAPRKFNRNSLLEPVDTRAVREYLTELHARSGDGGGGALASATTLHLRGAINMDDTTVVTVSYLQDADPQPAASEDTGSHYHAVVRGDGGAQLIDFPFHVNFHAHGDTEGVTAFGASIPFPEGARSVELLHEDEVLWSASRSPNAPVVAFTAPAGGSHAADAAVQVSWTASDPDGGPLQFALDYSADGGATWIKLPQYVTATSLSWRPGFLPRSDAARLRIRASDGFNTATALSAPFRLTPAAPVVFIKAPQDGVQIPEGSLVDLVAQSMTSEGIGQGTFLWQIDGQPLPGERDGNEHRFDVAGAHTIEVHLADPSGLPASHQITVQVIPDFDRDGIPNDWEQAHGLNPLDFTDGSKDPDGDDLSSYAEHVRGTDPQDADTDGDGAADGAEVLAGTNPLSPDSVPPAGPTLQLGIFELGFTVSEGDAASEPRSFWLLNHGPGNLDWSIANDVPWLQVSPGSGRAPSQVTLLAVPGGLGVGSYSGQIVIAAPGAAGSPHTILVHLTVKPAAPHGERRFIRGDSSSDGAMDISDAILTLQYLFIDATSRPSCLSAADANDDAKVDIADPIYSLAALFLGGPAPPPPFPACGTEATPDGLECAAGPICP